MPDGCKQFFKSFFFVKIKENSTAAKILEHAEGLAAIANGWVEDVAQNVADDVAEGVTVEPPEKKLRRIRCKTTSS